MNRIVAAGSRRTTPSATIGPITNAIIRSARVTSSTNSSIAPRARSRDSDGKSTIPSGTPITPSGIEKTVNAIVNAETEPGPRPVASDVATMNVIWPAPRRERARPHERERLRDVRVARVEARA